MAGFLLFLESLPEAEIVFYSASDIRRILYVLQRIPLPDGRSAIDLSYISKDDEYNVFSINNLTPDRKKDLNTVGQHLEGFSIDRALLIDDSESVVVTGQEKNHVKVTPIEAYGYDSPFEDHSSFGDQIPVYPELGSKNEMAIALWGELARVAALINEGFQKSNGDMSLIAAKLHQIQRTGSSSYPLTDPRYIGLGESILKSFLKPRPSTLQRESIEDCQQILKDRDPGHKE